MSRSSQTTEAIVLKRSNTGESDRIVTLLTKDQGKVVCVAKGVRKMASTKRAALEPGNHIKCLLVTTKSLPILTQATLINDCQEVRASLSRIRQLSQILEIFDQLFVEDSDDSAVYQQALELRNQVVRHKISSTDIRSRLEALLMMLGYQDPKETKYQTILEYVSSLSDKPMRSWEYLKV